MAQTDKNKENKPIEQQQDTQSDQLFLRFFRGQVVPYHFFRRHWMFVAVIISMVLMSTANKYDCQSKITEIKHLEKELLVEQANRVDASAKYNSLIRESSMKRLVDTMHVELISPESPSYIIK